MNIQHQIDDTIQNLEKERNIRVLFACESGSRAWGFESPDSDYDLRFIYTHPKDWYLELQEKKDYIDLMLPNDLDLAGWDLVKTLRLFATCNLALNEWIDSPIIYWQQDGFREELTALIPTFFKPRKAIHHYMSMAKGTAKDHFNGRMIKIKKLFYILRPLFACYWIEAKNSMPPTVFQTMLDSDIADSSLLSAIAEVQAQKVHAVEGEIIEAPEIMNQWIHDSLSHFEQIQDKFGSGNKPGWGALNAVLKKWTTST
ncbi:nucleotidyltransferase domain-containing protein [Puniceicoccaceae bacterium K14]|nr:nucleotidyltransferase domain-containing protein [Puniceicoccaceae bacterium K14]